MKTARSPFKTCEEAGQAAAGKGLARVERVGARQRGRSAGP